MGAIEQDVIDICTFADPFTETRSKAGPKGTNVEMVKNGRPLKLELKASGVVSEVGGRALAFPSVNSLLASDRFANLGQLAATQLLAAKAMIVKNRIPTHVRIAKQSFDTVGLAEKLGRSSEGRLRLMLLDGPAGIGKTFQIQQLVTQQAARLQKGDPAAPILHVSSKGRRLSNLQDVLAAATQEMNAGFFAKHVPTLVRRGLLIVAIDGFDELVDADGYEDSWLALKRFVEDVRNGGSMLLAARDTFIEEQELLVRIARSRDEIELVSGEVRGPSSTEALQWLSGSPSWKPAELQSDDATDLLREGSYALRPFFLRELWGIKSWSEMVESGPRTFLVNRLLNREAKLIAQQLGGTSAEKIQPALSSLLQEVALEMAERETDAAEVEHVAFLTQFCFEGLVDEASIRKLMHKSGSLALLELSIDKGYRKFPHSEVRHYFLAMSLLASLQSGSLPVLLRRYVLNTEELDVFAEVFLNSSEGSMVAAQYCATLLSSEASNDALAPNLSSLVTLFFSLGYLSRVDFAETVEATLAGGAPEGVISGSKFGRLDVTGADLSGVQFSAVDVATLVVDESTMVGGSYPTVSALEVRTLDGNSTIRGQKEILEWFTTRKRAASSGENRAARLLEKVARTSIRQFYLRATGDEDTGSALMSDSLWPLVSKVLSKHGRLEVHRAKPMHGRPSPLIRIKNPMALLDSNDKETRRILDDLLIGDDGSTD